MTADKLLIYIRKKKRKKMWNFLGLWRGLYLGRPVKLSALITTLSLIHYILRGINVLVEFLGKCQRYLGGFRGESWRVLREVSRGGDSPTLGNSGSRSRSHQTTLQPLDGERGQWCRQRHHHHGATKFHSQHVTSQFHERRGFYRSVRERHRALLSRDRRCGPMPPLQKPPTPP